MKEIPKTCLLCDTPIIGDMCERCYMKYELKQKPDTLTPDEDYRNDTGCGCVVAFVVVIIIFATAAGLWLFTR